MAYAAAVLNTPITPEYFDPQVSARTVRAVSKGKGFFKDHLLEVFRQNITDFALKDIEGIWKTEKSGQWFITFHKSVHAKLLETVGSLFLEENEIVFSNYEKQIVQLRVHWLNADVRNSFLYRYFSAFGKVLNVERQIEFSGNVKLFTGVRLVSIELSKNMKDKIPHISAFW